jgi:hypothetical protein
LRKRLDLRRRTGVLEETAGPSVAEPVGAAPSGPPGNREIAEVMAAAERERRIVAWPPATSPGARAMATIGHSPGEAHV